MKTRRNPAAKAVRSVRFRPRVVPSKKAYIRRPKHSARAADPLRSCALRVEPRSP
jgi:hypothetical protein